MSSLHLHVEKYFKWCDVIPTFCILKFSFKMVSSGMDTLASSMDSYANCFLLRRTLESISRPSKEDFLSEEILKIKYIFF